MSDKQTIYVDMYSYPAGLPHWSEAVRALGISFEESEAIPIADRVCLRGCTGVPDHLPAWLFKGINEAVPLAAPGKFLWCDKCGRPVDYFQVETPVREARDGIMTVHQHTGEVIVTVSCHGETWSATMRNGQSLEVDHEANNP